MDILTNEECRMIAEKALKKKDFFIENVELEVLSCSGYMSIVKSLIVRIKDNCEGKPLKFFVKEATPLNEFQKTVIENMKAFLKECQCYKLLLDAFSEYISGKVYPEFYFTRDDRILVLEDLTAAGFKVKTRNYDRAHCELTLEALAKFHAASIKYEDATGTVIGEMFPDLVLDAFYNGIPGSLGTCFIENTVKLLQAIFEKHFEDTETSIRNRVLDFVKNIPFKMNAPSQHKKVLSHGDLWGNNIMFKYDDDVPKEVRLIDFQLVSYRAPAYDVLQLLFLTTSKSFRQENIQNLLLHYHSHLSESLSEHGLQLSRHLSWTDFIETVKEFYPIISVVAFVYNHFVFIPHSQLSPILKDPKLLENLYCGERITLVLTSIEASEEYKNLVFEAIQDLIYYITYVS